MEKCWKIYANLAPKLKSISGSPCESQQELAKSGGETKRKKEIEREGERERDMGPWISTWLTYFVLWASNFLVIYVK